jgi:hypothetical protein
MTTRYTDPRNLRRTSETEDRNYITEEQCNQQSGQEPRNDDYQIASP